MFEARREAELRHVIYKQKIGNISSWNGCTKEIQVRILSTIYSYIIHPVKVEYLWNSTIFGLIINQFMASNHQNIHGKRNFFYEILVLLGQKVGQIALEYWKLKGECASKFSRMYQMMLKGDQNFFEISPWTWKN